MNDYSIPKPTYPLYLKLLAGLVTVGLFGLGLVSFHTFNQVHGPLVAAIYAAIIEVGAALDAIGLAGGINRRSWWIVPAVLLTVAGSGWYNLAAVAQSGATWGIENPGELLIIRYAIAWLPLASLSFMALGLGFKISDHEQNVKAWEIARQKWQDDQARQAEKAEQERIEAQRQADLEARRIEAAAAENIRLAELKAQERQQKRELKAAEDSVKAAEIAVKSAEASVKLQKGTYEDFMQAMQSNGVHKWTAEDIAARFSVSTRTGFTWLARYKSEHQPITQGVN